MNSVNLNQWITTNRLCNRHSKKWFRIKTTIVNSVNGLEFVDSAIMNSRNELKSVDSATVLIWYNRVFNPEFGHTSRRRDSTIVNSITILYNNELCITKHIGNIRLKRHEPVPQDTLIVNSVESEMTVSTMISVWKYYCIRITTL